MRELKPITDRKIEELPKGDCFMCHMKDVPIEYIYKGKKVCNECNELLFLSSVFSNDIAREGRKQEAIKKGYGKEVS